ncbi:paar motif family protein [Herbaspirillum rubrisubalbicans M1]|uniref:PAAR domain-containing protein n=1 Tax=Herbaspirillum rubrisubalbicans TaxID=80842 RepID=UPI00073A1FC5|nr:PAAR domain-containing protein [Herbaspirillum rubrisubalbicans]ALU91128.1 paar motif family protein [Herbaspirillum rubrisubalbicans M1]
MSRPIIVIGDKTSHGGSVIEGSGQTLVGNKLVARIGDQVSCPRHGTTRIVSGDATMVVDGSPVARDGDKTACGAVLIASQASTTL